MASSILYKNLDSTIFVIDIPRSIELVQGDSSCKIFSQTPVEEPFPSTEPKSKKARAKFGKPPQDELFIPKYLEFALKEAREAFEGKEWCLSRACLSEEENVPRAGNKRKRKEPTGEGVAEGAAESPPEDPSDTKEREEHVPKAKRKQTGTWLFQNPSESASFISLADPLATGYLPPKSTALCGSIAETRDVFVSKAPKDFPLIILDPPWPNRSVRRHKKGYAMAYDDDEIYTLLSSIPISDHLATGGQQSNEETNQDEESPDDAVKVEPSGLVGIWITNKSGLYDMVTGDNGIFEKWGLELVEEWVWLKVAKSGEPVYVLDALNKKPFERMLVGRRKTSELIDVTKRILIAVGDIHSRKPSLKELFRLVGILPSLEDVSKDHEGLEIFARNLTEGWWSWGNQCLKFQMEESWKKPPGAEEEVEPAPESENLDPNNP